MTCKYVERFALDTPETLKLVQQHDVALLKADYTHESAEIKRWLEKFDSISVPLTVIFPGNRPQKPIVLRDVYTQSRLLESLQQAVDVDAEPGRQAARSATPGSSQGSARVR